MPTITAKRLPVITPAVEPIPATMIPTSPRGTIPTPTQVTAALPASATRARPEGTRDHGEERDAGQGGQDADVGQRAKVNAQTDENKEEWREEGVERCDLLLEVVAVSRLGDDHPGEERPADRRRPDLGGDCCQLQAEDHRWQSGDSENLGA